MTLNGIVEKVEEIMGYLEAALVWLPGSDPRVAMLRKLVKEINAQLAMSDVRVAMAEVEANASAKAQAVANNWPAPKS